MKSLLRFLPFTIAALASGTALAADYDPPIYVEQIAEEYKPVEIGNGWYLRGDVGYAFSISPGTFNYRTFQLLPPAYNAATFDTGDLSTDITYGIGFGYQFTDWLRADLTADMFKGRFDGTTSAPVPCVDPVLVPGYAGTTCRSEDTTEFTAFQTMLNGYVDLGTYAGFTPYVGAGVGATLVKWDDLNSSNFCVAGAGACPAPGGVVATSTHPGLDSWRFTYAFMGGLAYDVSRNLKIDLGYKYSRVDGGNMFGFDAGTAAAGASGTQGTDSGFDQHEVRIGLRYSLW